MANLRIESQIGKEWEKNVVEESRKLYGSKIVPTVGTALDDLGIDVVCFGIPVDLVIGNRTKSNTRDFGFAPVVFTEYGRTVEISCVLRHKKYWVDNKCVKEYDVLVVRTNTNLPNNHNHFDDTLQISLYASLVAKHIKETVISAAAMARKEKK